MLAVSTASSFICPTEYTWTNPVLCIIVYMCSLQNLQKKVMMKKYRFDCIIIHIIHIIIITPSLYVQYVCRFFCFCCPFCLSSKLVHWCSPQGHCSRGAEFLGAFCWGGAQRRGRYVRFLCVSSPTCLNSIEIDGHTHYVPYPGGEPPPVFLGLGDLIQSDAYIEWLAAAKTKY